MVDPENSSDQGAQQETAAPETSESTGEPARRERGLLRRLGNRFVLLWLAFVALGQVWVWKFWDPLHGASMQNMVTVSMGIVTCVVLLVWILCLSRMKWLAAIPLSMLILLPAGVLLGSIRRVEFTGDMRPVLHFRWEPTELERIQSAPQLPVPETAATEAEFPAVRPEDFAEYRGTHRDGVVTGPPLRQDWSDASALEMWRSPCGGGYSSFAVVDDYAVTIEQWGDEEAIVCYSLETGGKRWTQTYPAHFQEAMGGPGPRSTPTIHQGFVFTLGAYGDLHCWKLLDGERVWSVNILTDNGLLWPSGEDRRQVPTWAIAGSPLIVDELVVVNAGGPKGNGLVAYKFETGERVWQGAGLNTNVSQDAENRAGYSSPMLVELDGVRQIINFDGVGLWGCVPESGAKLWSHRFDGGSGGDPGRVNVAQPLLQGENRVFISASYGRGCAMLKIERQNGHWQAARLWPDEEDVNLELRSKFTSPVLHEGFIYGLDEGIMVCLDPESGERLWKRGRFGHGQLLLTNGQMVVLSEYGELVLVDPDPEGLREITRFEALPGEKTWNPPVLVRGRALVRNHMETACFNLAAE